MLASAFFSQSIELASTVVVMKSQLGSKVVQLATAEVQLNIKDSQLASTSSQLITMQSRVDELKVEVGRLKEALQKAEYAKEGMKEGAIRAHETAQHTEDALRHKAH